MVGLASQAADSGPARLAGQRRHVRPPVPAASGGHSNSFDRPAWPRKVFPLPEGHALLHLLGRNCVDPTDRQILRLGEGHAAGALAGWCVEFYVRGGIPGRGRGVHQY
uniref:(northern house mosquito) hypothetical protein n=1 Tax=Culex pipiens TaxID=7175 RepID=A0A8D8E1K8_CULPI